MRSLRVWVMERSLDDSIATQGDQREPMLALIHATRATAAGDEVRAIADRPAVRRVEIIDAAGFFLDQPIAVSRALAERDDGVVVAVDQNATFADRAIV